MSDFNMPPGVNSWDIPGNRKQDIEADNLFEKASQAFAGGNWKCPDCGAAKKDLLGVPLVEMYEFLDWDSTGETIGVTCARCDGWIVLAKAPTTEDKIHAAIDADEARRKGE